MQVHPRAPQTLTDASVSVEPTRTRSRPPFFVSVTCSAASTATLCGSSGSSTSASDFASQAVWGVVITTIVVAVGLVVALIYVKRRVRRRNR
jgi:membrane protein DedA with SNARE-associated domain